MAPFRRCVVEVETLTGGDAEYLPLATEKRMLPLGEGRLEFTERWFAAWSWRQAHSNLVIIIADSKFIFFGSAYVLTFPNNLLVLVRISQESAALTPSTPYYCS